MKQSGYNDVRRLMKSRKEIFGRVVELAKTEVSRIARSKIKEIRQDYESVREVCNLNIELWS